MRAVSLRDESLFNASVIVSHRQLTDVYLLGLATRMGGALATFDAGPAPRREGGDAQAPGGDCGN